jgi:hypothetical protein
LPGPVVWRRETRMVSARVTNLPALIATRCTSGSTSGCPP